MLLGWVEHDGRPFLFATQIRGKDASGAKARGITEQILGKLELLYPQGSGVSPSEDPAGSLVEQSSTSLPPLTAGLPAGPPPAAGQLN